MKIGRGEALSFLLGFVFVALFSLVWSPVTAVTATIVPDSDISSAWPTCSSGCMAMMQYSNVDEGTTTDTTDWIGTGTNGSGSEQVTFGLSTVSSVDTASQVSISTSLRSATLGDVADSVTVELLVNGSPQTGTGTGCNPTMTTSWSLRSCTFSGTWSQADVDSMRVRLTRTVNGGGSPSGRDDDVQLANVYAQVDYTSAVALEQAAYRFHANTDSVTPGAALAAANTPAVSGGDFRLQMLTHVNSGQLAENSKYKLQYSKKSSGTCSAYQDIGPIVAEEGYLSGSSATDAANRSWTWTQPSNALVQDGAEAVVDLLTGGTVTTSDLVVTGYGFNIPAGATVKGVTVDIMSRRTGLVATYAELTSGGIKIGNAKSSYATTAATPVYNSYGSSSDAWGAASITPAQINSSDFGVVIRGNSNSQNLDGRYLYIDHVRIRVAYSQSVNGDIEFIDNPTVSDRSLAQDVGLLHSNHMVDTQVYAETNPIYTRTNQVVDAGQDALWDYALGFTPSATPGTYCLRLAESSGSTLSITQTVVPEITLPAPQLAQGAYRFYENSDSAVPGLALAGQNTAASIDAGQPFRLRFLLNQTVGFSGAGHGFRLQAAEKSTTCAASVFQDLSPSTGVSTGLVYGNAAASVSAGEDYTWREPEFALDYGGQSATNYYIGSAQYPGVLPTEKLQVSDFNFNIPANATVDGIKAEYETIGYSGFSNENSIRLMKNGAPVGSDLSQGVDLSPKLVTRGSETELWGQIWTPADINSAGFGVSFQAMIDIDYNDYPGEADVDYLRLEVFYSVPASQNGLTFHDNLSLADDSQLQTSANDPAPAVGSVVAQHYSEEGNLTTLSIIPNGGSGLWDISLAADPSLDGKTYCFRVVEEDGSLLAQYSNYPEISFGSVGSEPTPGGPSLDEQVRGGQSVVDGIKAPFSW